MEQLHFLHPLWLTALLPLAILWWLTVRSKMSNSKAWEKVIDARLLPLLLSGSDEKQSQSESFAKWLLALTWFIATIALADPVWEKIPRPVFQTNSARVIVLDLSNSMQITDLKPSRIARARFKIEDILSDDFTNNEEGQIGLVLFAGDAFTASPLTRDSETIRALLQVLSPDIMPSQGSRVDLGLQKAHELLTQAGVNNGQVLLIADGVSDQHIALEVAQKLKDDGHKLSVLGVGTEFGGKLPQIKYQNGDSITVALDAEFLQEIAHAGGGQYHLISTSNADLKRVLSTTSSNANKPQEQNEDIKSEDWKSSGPFIILLLLPLAALAFRRGWLFNILIVASFFSLLQPQPVLASPLTESLANGWNNLWINKEQQAEIALKQQQYDKASKLSSNPLMRGTANYKQEKYTKALEDFKQVGGADARYNEGNALAKLEKYEDAISAYDKALKLQPDMEDAKKNKAAIEKLLEKKQEQKKDSKKNSSDENKEQEDSGSKKENENTDKQDDKQSNKGKEKKNNDNDEKNKGNQADKKNGEKSKNQFSDANKDLDKPKEDKDRQNKKDSANQKPDEKSQKEEDKISTKKEQVEKEKRNNEEQEKQKGTKTEAEELSKEEKMAAEQWLRRIPDDPGGLLRRKFEQQYQQRKRQINGSKQPW